MNSHRKFKACLKKAEEIVRSYRNGAPENCDPQNSWIALGVSAVVAVGSAAYASYNQSQANKAIDAANKATQKKFKKIDFASVNRDAINTDATGYAASDEDWAKRFPTLAKMRTGELEDVQQDVTGSAPPTALVNGLSTAGFDAAGLGGSQTRQARNLGLPVTAIRDRGRSYFGTLLGQNPQRSFGLSGKDASDIAIANTNSQNILAGAINGSNINAYNSSIAQQGQNNQLLIGTLASLANGYINRPPASGTPSAAKFGGGA